MSFVMDWMLMSFIMDWINKVKVPGCLVGMEDFRVMWGGGGGSEGCSLDRCH